MNIPFFTLDAETPSGVSVSDITSSSVYVYFNDSALPDTEDYIVYYGLTPGSYTYSVSGTSSPIEITGLLENITYYYVVVQRALDGYESSYSTEIAHAIDMADDEEAPEEIIPTWEGITHELTAPLLNPSGCWKDYNNAVKRRRSLLRLSRIHPGLMNPDNVPSEEYIDPDLYPDNSDRCGR